MSPCPMSPWEALCLCRSEGEEVQGWGEARRSLIRGYLPCCSRRAGEEGVHNNKSIVGPIASTARQRLSPKRISNSFEILYELGLDGSGSWRSSHCDK